MVWRQRMGGCESNPQTQNNENENSLEKEEDSHKAIMEKTLTLHAGESPKESNPPKHSLEKAKERNYYRLALLLRTSSHEFPHTDDSAGERCSRLSVRPNIRIIG
ncbi:hypothetical protein FH972_026760 [Carpinus fangiana]|uniref:Uncharacterized protein n=1 Tax=Carpinus fangiana TaxID=176857 RepID=A0A5N6L508_9ROSI|nr:hypothetical protein FH972_026760 [Carpinus fangiana]